MLRCLILAGPVLLLASGCALNAGPNQHDLAAALGLTPDRITAPRCYDIPEEPTEFGCSYRERNNNGDWERRKLMVAIDGGEWVVIDPPGPPR